MNVKANHPHSKRNMRGGRMPMGIQIDTSMAKKLPAGGNPVGNEGTGCLTVLLVGGPYQGMRIHESMNSKNLYFVDGKRGKFVYRLYRREDQNTIAVPFSASAQEIQTGLFKLAGMSITKRTQRWKWKSQSAPGLCF